MFRVSGLLLNGLRQKKDEIGIWKLELQELLSGPYCICSRRIPPLFPGHPRLVPDWNPPVTELGIADHHGPKSKVINR
jgi:hypothetical protein